MATDDKSLAAGTIIRNTYRLDKMIAKGGMGMVFKGTHLRLNKAVAIKVLLPHYVKYTEQIRRFLNEALGIANVQHRNIVNMMDVGATQTGIPYFVMELLQGESLRDRIKRKKIMPVEEISWIISQALAGISVLHASGIVHRDMKPSNIFLSREADGTQIVKVLDFGVSKFHILEGDEILDLTTTGTILGTPSYMSPEQAGGKRALVDTRTDIYSCGVIMYRALTGINPFKGENYNETIANILNAPVPPPSFFAQDLTPEIDKLILKTMERDRDKRFQKAQEFMSALKEYADRYDPSAAREPVEGDDVEDSGEAARSGEAEAEGSGRTPSVEVDLEKILGTDFRIPKPPLEHTPVSSSGTGVSVPEKKGRRLGLVAGVVALVIAVLVAGGWFLSDMFRHSHTGSESRPPDPPAAGAVEDEEPRQWRIELKGVPDEAAVFVDGIMHPERPLIVGDQKGQRNILIEAPGYRAWEYAVSIVSDIMIPVKMKPEDPAAGAEDDKHDAAKGKKKKSKDGKGKGDEDKDGKKDDGEKDILRTYPGK